MKRHVLIIFLICSLSIFLSSCASWKVYVVQDTPFSKKDKFTIIGGDDVTGTRGELTHFLIEKGFNVVSYATAQESIEREKEVTGSDKVNYKVKEEVHRGIKVNSVYAIELKYRYSWDLVHYVYNTFSMQVIDLRTGEVCVTGRYSGTFARDVSKTLEMLASELNKKVQQ